MVMGTKKKTATKMALSKKTVTKKPTAKKAALHKTAANKTRPRTKKFNLVIDSAKGATWITEPHRPQFEYRHFGIEEATKRKYGSHVIRVAKGAKPPVRHHVHPDCEFLQVMILKGWVKFWYDGVGEKKLSVGDVHLLVNGSRDAGDHAPGRLRFDRSDRRANRAAGRLKINHAQAFLQRSSLIRGTGAIVSLRSSTPIPARHWVERI